LEIEQKSEQGAVADRYHVFSSEFPHNYNLNIFVHVRPLGRVGYARTFCSKMKLAEMHAADPIAQELHLHVVDQTFDEPDSAGAHFGLKAIGDCWRAVDRDTARSILITLLREDMAYSLERIPLESAESGADEFLGAFSPGSQHFTNGNWEAGWSKSAHGGAAVGPGWQPVTDATFDGGILVLDSSRTGLLWFEDED
jgi:hypothetical protein